MEQGINERLHVGSRLVSLVISGVSLSLEFFASIEITLKTNKMSSSKLKEKEVDINFNFLGYL